MFLVSTLLYSFPFDLLTLLSVSVQIRRSYLDDFRKRRPPGAVSTSRSLDLSFWCTNVLGTRGWPSVGRYVVSPMFLNAVVAGDQVGYLFLASLPPLTYFPPLLYTRRPHTNIFHLRRPYGAVF